MSNVDDEEDRRNLLDVFAATEQPSESREVARVDQRSVGRRVWGAQLILRDRDTRKVLEEIKQLAAGAGEEWYYRWPVNEKYKEGGVTKTRVKWIEGLGIKGANAVFRSWGNDDVQIDDVEDHGAYWVFHARFIDLQTGASMSRPYRQRQSQTGIKTDKERSLDIAFQIGASKAIRNVVNNVLSDICRFALEQALDANVEKYAKAIDKYRERLAARFEDLNFDIARVEAVMGRKVGNWKPRDVARVMAMGVSVADEMATWDELCPPLGQPVVGLADQAAPGADGAATVTTAGEAAGFAAGTTTEQKAGVKAAEASGEKVDPKTGELLKASIAAEDAKAADTKPAAAEAATKPAEGAAKAAEPAAAGKAPATDDPMAGGPAKPAAAAATNLEETGPDLGALRAAGAQAKKDGKSRSAMPKELRAGRDAEANAWLEGFSGREREPGEEG